MFSVLRPHHPRSACPAVGRFTAEEDVSGYSQAKMSVARGIRTKLLEQCPEMGPYVDGILPKKEALGIVKW